MRRTDDVTAASKVVAEAHIVHLCPAAVHTPSEAEAVTRELARSGGRGEASSAALLDPALNILSAHQLVSFEKPHTR